MSYPVGTVAISKISDEVPVWVKTIKGWAYVLPADSDTGLMPEVIDSDFETDGDEHWQFIEPLGLRHNS